MFAVIYVIDVLGIDVMPLLLSNIDFIMPMKMPLTDVITPLGYWSNFFMQDIAVTAYSLFYATFNTIFIIFAVHLLQELKIISMFCHNVGKYEKHEIVKEILDNLTAADRQGERFGEVNIGNHLSLIESEKTLTHNLKDFHLENDVKGDDQVNSQILLKIIVVHHANALR